MLDEKKVSQLKQLKELLEQGILTQVEFDEKKAKILGDQNEGGFVNEEDQSINASENIADGVAEESSDISSRTTKENGESPTEPLSEDRWASFRSGNMDSAGSKTTVKKPFYKRKVFIIPAIAIIALLIIIGIGVSENENDTTSSKPAASSSSSGNDEPKKEESKTTSITATYSGYTEAGTVLDSDNSGIVVMGKKDDGGTTYIVDWTIDEPQTLEAGKESTVTIRFGELTCDLTVQCSTVDEGEYKNSCSVIAYEELARNPGTYEGQNVMVSGKVIQVVESNGSNDLILRIATKGRYDDVVLVSYTYREGESRVLEDDNLTVWGPYAGTYTYESTGGGDITIPHVRATYLQIN